MMETQVFQLNTRPAQLDGVWHCAVMLYQYMG